jgi:uncharacterized protein (TIGR01777 family)
MRIIIPGGSGLIGQALIPTLVKDGHEVWVLSRNPQKTQLPGGAQGCAWDGKTAQGWLHLVEGAGAIINLAGENLGSGLWTAEKKQRILDSRVQAGQAIAAAVKAVKILPGVLIQSSAIGCYGKSEIKTFDESSPMGDDNLSRICMVWEGSTDEVERLGVRRVIVRTGLLLTPKGGVLPRLVLPFKMMVGGPLGSGKQWYSWIHLDDWIAAVRFLLANDSTSGIFNLTAPEPVTQAEFGRTTAYILRRPYLLPAPAFALRTVLGEMSTLVLDGQRVLPKRLREMGFKFRYEKLHEALKSLLK